MADLRLDVHARQVWQGDKEVHLTAKEFDLLRILARDAGKVVTRDQIMREVWRVEWWGSTKTLDMHISWLRRKLGDDDTWPGHIITVRGVGFRFDGTAEIVGGPISPELSADASALTRALLADLRAMADQAEKRLAELEHAAELELLPDEGATSGG